MQVAFYFIVLAIFAVLALSFVVFSGLIARGASTIWIIAMAVKNNLPLPDLVDAQAGEYSGRRGKQMHDLADMLREGVPLPIAVDHYGRLIPDKGRLAMRVGADSGTLAESLEATAEDLTQRQNFEFFNNYYLLCYTLLVLNALLVVVWFLMYFVVPKYQEILTGFGAEPGIAFQWVLAISRSEPIGWIYFALQLTLLILLVRALFPVFHLFALLDRVDFLRSVIRGMLYPIRPFGILVDRLTPQRHTRDILGFLAINSRSLQPLGQTIDSLARYHPSQAVQRRLTKCVERLKAGEGIWDSLQSQRFITAREMGLLKAAEMSGQLPFALEEQMRSRDLSRAHRYNIFIEFARTFGILLLALWVGLIAFAFFSPLVQLINDLEAPSLFPG